MKENMVKRIIKSNFLYLILSVICGWAEVIFTVKSLLLIGGLLDIATGSIEENLKIHVLKIISLVILLFVMSVLQKYFQQKFSIACTGQLRKDIISNLFQESTIKFREINSDEYIGLLETDIEQIRINYFGSIPNVITRLGQVLIYGFALFRFNIFIFIASILVSLLPMIINRSFIKPLNKIELDRSQKNSFYFEKLSELLGGYSTIKRSNNEDKFVENVSLADNDKLEAVKKLNVIQTIAMQGLFAANFISIATIILIGSVLVNQGKMELAEVIAAMSMVSTGSNAFGSFLGDYLKLKSSNSLFEKIKKLSFVEQDSTKERSDIKNIFPLTFNDVSFAFANKKILDDFNFNFNEGGSYGVVGDSGSGKTTVARLILKEHENYQGTILLGAEDIENISENNLYEYVDYIPQTPFIFKDTLKNNISMLYDYDKDKMNDIIKNVNLEGILQTHGDEILNPINLSGGEKQRIAIARALYKDSKLIIFDEPTSGLDPYNREMIDQLIFSLKNTSKIVITHNWDKNFLSKFDEVIRIKNGGEKYIV